MNYGPRRLGRPASSHAATRVNRRGASLLELTLAIPAMAILVAGLGASIKIAVMAVPDGTSVSDSTVAAARALDQLAGEVAFATAFNSDLQSPVAARQISFTLPDRDGKLPTTETVSYSWSGTAGAPLLRTYNGNTSTVANNVQEFVLTYSKQAVSVDNTTSVTSSEVLLADYDVSPSTTNDYGINDTKWPGQYFFPTLAANVTGWNVTKVRLHAKSFNAVDGETLVQVRPSVNRLPTTTVLAEGKFLENTLQVGYTKVDVIIPGMLMLSPTEPVCIVLKLGRNAPACKVERWPGGTRLCHSFSTDTAGSTWIEESTISQMCEIYGTLTSQSTSTSTQYRLKNVHCTLRVGSSPRAQLNTTVRILNEPQVNGP